MEKQTPKSPENDAEKGPVLTATSREILLGQAKEASGSPGVYLMKDSAGGVLYVGKAKNLKNRVTTYFQAARHESFRTELLVNQVHHFDVILTETESEALILECTLIKKYKPRFNVRLKDDKAYPYIKIRMDDVFPKLEWTRRVLKDGSRYFGPFPSAYGAREVLSLLKETFKLRDCSDNTFKHRSRPCILNQIGKCTAPCVGLVDSKDYAEQVQGAVDVLEGKGKDLILQLEKGMKDSAEREEFEEAARYRDQLKYIRAVTETQGVLEPGSERNRDVVGIARNEKDSQAHGVLLQIRSGQLLGVKHYHLQNVDQSLGDSEILYDLLAQHYVESENQIKKSKEGAGVQNLLQPKEVLLPLAPDDPDLLEKTLGVGIRVAENEKDEQLLNVARTNAEHALEVAQKKAEGHGMAALEDVQKKLHLAKLPGRIECFDISNIQGEDAVASRVVFIDGAPDKSLYRRYKIRTVEGANDFAMMKEVLSRRFKNQDDSFPDLLIVDGGKGQLSQAVAIFEELNLQGIDVIGLAKARTEKNFQAKEVKMSSERAFLPNRKNPVILAPHTAAFKILTHLRDEAHRFAISYHRVVRSKKTLKSDSNSD